MVVKWREQGPGDKYLTFDYLHDSIPRSGSDESSRGWALRHPQSTFRFNPTVPVRVAYDGLTTLLNNMKNRWEFTVLKVDEYMEISPSHPYYQTIIKQKHELIRQVKEGLSQIDRAVSDTELLMHDKRRYKEILSYFAKEDEHSLKAMFIDQVDANLPEGVSLRSIAPRWPTIIADFQELSDEDDTVEKIRKKIEISKAEAVILTTKVRLYKRWKDLFGDEVKQRYKMIVQRLMGRRTSIEEYMNWVRPLIRRVFQMREVDDNTLIMNANLPAGAGFPYAIQYIEYWAWTRMEGLEPTEPHKTPREIHLPKGVSRYPPGQSRMQYHIEGNANPKFAIEPYDDVVKKWIPEIEKKHGVKITKEDILEARRRLFTTGSPGNYWYIMLQIPVGIQVMKTREGQEIEDIDFNPISSIFVTQNVVLERIIEIIAEEKKVDYYIEELLGKKIVGEDGIVKSLDEVLKEDFPEIYGKMEEEESSVFKTDINSKIKNSVRTFCEKLYELFGIELLLVKGPYAGNLKNLITHGFGRPYYREVFGKKIFPCLLGSFAGV